VLGNEVAGSKVEKIGLARRRYGDGDGSWYVGDTVGDIDEARDAGACTVAAAWGWHSRERLARARPDHIAATPADLLTLLDA